MKTFWIKISLFILLLSQLGASFILASNQNPEQKPQPGKCESMPSVCQATPESLNLYLDFQREIIALLQTNPFETITETISRTDGGLFVNKLLKLPEPSVLTENMVTRSLNTVGTAAEQILISNLTTIFLFQLSATTTIWDGLMGFLILFQERPLVRDYKKLLEIERDYSTLANDLGKQMLIAKKIKNTEPLQQVIKRYQEKGLLLGKSQFPTSLHYTDVLADLISLNIKMKLFLWSTSTAQFSLRASLQDKPSLYLGFNEKWIEQLENDYRCVQGLKFGFKCNQSFKNFGAELKHLAKTSWKSLTSAKDTIVLSLRRLHEALLGTKMYFKNKSKSFSEYEREILRSREWSLTQNERAYLINFSQRMKSQWREAKNAWSEEIFSDKKREDVDKFWDKLSFSTQLEINQKRRLTTASNTFRQEDLYRNMQSAFLKFKEHEENLLQEIQFGDSLAVCREFWTLALEIQEIAKIVGDKSNGLRGQAYNVCSFQCSNKGELECYTK